MINNNMGWPDDMTDEEIGSIIMVSDDPAASFSGWTIKEFADNGGFSPREIWVSDYENYVFAFPELEE